MDEKKRQTNINSLMIQSYFDGELNSEEFEAISHEDLVNSETYKALDELRRVVRTEAELALDDIDGYALLDAINRQIDEDLKPSLHEQPTLTVLSAPKRRTSKQFFQRWAPALIGAALFLLSIPGLIHWIAIGSAQNDTQSQPQTVVVIDSNGAVHSQGMVNYQNPSQNVLAVPSAQNGNNSQLTVEEMDFAIRHLIKRIETLENANQNHDSGTPLLGDVPEQDGQNL